MPQKIESDDRLVTETPRGPVLGRLPHSFQLDKRHQIRILVLNDGQNLDSTLYRLEKGWTVEFRLGPSLLGKKITIYCNHPSSASEDFHRKEYRVLEWQYGSSGEVHNNNCNDDTAIFAQLHIRRAGSFHYYFVEDGSEKPSGSGYFTVDPVLAIGNKEDEVLPLDSVQCQTVLAKSLGAFEDWNDRLRVSKESGYNVIHFTPTQALGDSNSSYSLKDQLKLNPIFSSEKKIPTFDDVLDITEKMRREWKVLSICDVVLNHTANESPWLLEHPECTYNMVTSPHLIPAAILDASLHVFTKEISEGKFSERGIPNEVYTQQHVDAIKHYLQNELVPNLKLYELYICDVEALGGKFKDLAKKSTPTSGGQNSSDLALIKDSKYRRNTATVDLDLGVRLFNVYRTDANNDEERLIKCTDDFKQRLRELNSVAKHEIEVHLNAAINNCIANINYFRLQDDGPKLRKVSEQHPLVPRYFTGNFKDYKSIENEIYNKGQFAMAHNGWVMNSDPLKNFADPDSNVYIRRELIAWGDSVKLRYGDSPADCPFLWDHMRKYVEKTAELFDGIRLDNCHSTPLPVAEYLLDCARKIRPDLYVVAELFTNSDATDNIFVNRLGITSLIREAMSAWDSHELGRLVYRYGGESAGSFFSTPVRPLVPSIAHALFLDISHDNPSPIQKKSVFDLVPTSGLVAMACCASGSTRGYDELVPHHIHVVDETRLYTSWTDEKVIDNARVNNQSGIIAAKKALNKLHQSLSEEGYNQVFVDQMNENVVAVTRHNPESHETVVLVSYTAFSHPHGYVPPKPDIRDLKVEGVLSEIILECSFRNKSKDNPFGGFENFKLDERFVNGLTEYEISLKENIKIEESDVLQLVSNVDAKVARFEFKVFQPGSVVAIRVSPHPNVKLNFQALDELADSFLDVTLDDGASKGKLASPSTENLTENGAKYVQAWRTIIKGPNKSWVLFENGTCVILMEPEADLAAQATELLREYGPVYAGTPAGDFNTLTLEEGKGWVVIGHHSDILNFVSPDEVEASNANHFFVGLLGRSKRDEDGKNLQVIHVEDNRNATPALKLEEKLVSVVSELNLGDLNYALYRCSEEDQEEGTGSYNISGYGNLVYCGLQGFVSALNDIRLANDLGHPICHNLRQGDWMLDYVSGRLKSEKGTLKLGLWFQSKFEILRQLPRYLIPRYFEIIINGVHQLVTSRAIFLMNDFVKSGSTFVRGLALGSVQCAGVIESAPLPPFSPSLVPANDNERKITLSAGLPHFATGYMRSWGRDTFISLRGLLILTGRFKEARYHILGYAGCLRHGLIPNLLDRGVNARFNCRDAVWWWLHSIVSYIESAPQGEEILKDPVSRIFPTDDSPPMGPGVVEQPLFEVMQEALNVHFQGLAFRERNAGSTIDAHMTDLGFNNNIGVNLETGFIYGGNEHNCGTWMDKMGSSRNAGNKGRPATPRDGSAVELVSLCKAVLRELAKLNERGVYPYSNVERVDEEGKTTEWSFKQWEEKIAENFEKQFWVPAEPEASEPRPDLVHRRGIYKDSIGASQPWADYQLRPNFLIALVVAPEMLDPAKAWTAIQKAEELLLGPLGIKTLDPADWNYNGDYNNDNDGNDIKIAHGFNYHQGPEWLWPVGYFLRAKLHFAKLRGEDELKKVIPQIRSYLSTHYNELITSHWRGLPELTNRDGAYCSGSCRVQAWSMGCILEVLHDLHILEKVSKAADSAPEAN